eukprot:Gregarina_sp_Poly_1__10468@NODE_762_length_6387_cov_60_360285_g562_i0_p1_GENE_NODE_762_length_6387_cov_60_360285_g562_i0NODE_762_length_6387_cov_60_360285_g562_i0_p1_ORF_typecomplete_len664_score87_48_NODE_762_length_6387_cov_60_360285_g562_i018053796
MRYNLLNSENFTRSRSIFWGAIFPFLIAWLVSNDSHFSTLLTWSSLVFSLTVNFIAPCLIFLVACCVSKPSTRNPVCDARRNAFQNFLIGAGFYISFLCASEKALEEFASMEDTEYEFIQLHFRLGQRTSILPDECMSARETPSCLLQPEAPSIRDIPNNPFAPSPASLRSPQHSRRLPWRSNRFSREVTPSFIRSSLNRSMLGNGSVSSRLISNLNRRFPPRNVSTSAFKSTSPSQARVEEVTPSPSLMVQRASLSETRNFPGVKRKLPAPDSSPPFQSKVSRLHLWDTVGTRRSAVTHAQKKSTRIQRRVPASSQSSQDRRSLTDHWRRRLRRSHPHLDSTREKLLTHSTGTQSVLVWPWTETDGTHRSARSAIPISAPNSVRSSAHEEVTLRRMFGDHHKSQEDISDDLCWSDFGHHAPTVPNSRELDLPGISENVSNSHTLTLVPHKLTLPAPVADYALDDTARSSAGKLSPLLSTIGSECIFTTDGFRETILKTRVDSVPLLDYRPRPDSDSPRKLSARGPPIRKRSLLGQETIATNCILPSPARRRAELQLPLPLVRKRSPLEETTCGALDSDGDSSDCLPPIKGAEDAYEQDEDILGEVENIRIHVFPKGFLRRNHIELTVILLFMLTLSCIFTASFRIYDDLTAVVENPGQLQPR